MNNIARFDGILTHDLLWVPCNSDFMDIPVYAIGS